MPSSRQARMIRTAISPRLAMRTRPKGGRRGPSLRKDIIASGPAGSVSGPASATWEPATTASERDVAMLLSGVRVALVGKHLESADKARPRLRWPDDVVDVA